MFRRWLEELSSKDHHTRLRCGDALKALWSGDRNQASEVLDAALNSADANAQSEACRVVAAVQARDLAPLVRRVAEDRRLHGRARKAAVTALGVLGDRHGVAAARSLLSHDNPMYRRASAEALGRIGGPDVNDSLLIGLGDDAWQVRMAAAVGLSTAQHQVDGVGRALIDALGAEVHEASAEQMARSLSELAGHSLPLRDRVAETFVTLLTSGSSPDSLMRAAARGLGELLWHPSADVLRRTAEGGPALVAAEAQWSLDRLANDANGGISDP